MRILDLFKSGNKGMKFYKDAEILISSASKFALYNKPIFLEKYPQLYTADNLENWDLYFTIVTTYIALMDIKYVPSRFRYRVCEIVSSELNRFHKQALITYDDFLIYADEELKSYGKYLKMSLPGTKVGILVIREVMKSWFIENLMNNKTLENGSAIALDVVNTIIDEFASYWILEK